MGSYERIKDTENPAAYRYGGALPADSELLAQLLKETEVQQLFESYYKLIKIPVAIIDLKANVLLSSRWQRICTQFHRVNPETCRRCVESDTTIATQLTQGRQHAIFPCANGLTDCASPIVIDGKYVANVFIGQFMTQKPDEERFRRQAAEFGFPVEDYLAAAREVPVVDEAKVPVIMDLLERMTRVITTLSVDRKRALENKALLSAIFEGTQDFIWTVDPVEFGIMTWNAAFGTYFSKSRGINDLAGKRPQDVFPDQEFVAWWKSAYASALRDGRYTAEYTTYRSGITMLLELNLLKKEDRPFAISVFGKNITERKQAEEKYRALFESAQDGIALADAESGVLLDCNPALCRLTGRGREELIGQKQSVLHPQAESPGRKADTFKQHLLENPGVALEDVLIQKSGKLLPVEIRASRLQINGREVMLGLFRDIAERKQAEEVLRASEEKFRVLVEGTNDIVYSTSPEGVITYVSPQIARYGWTPEELLGQSILTGVAEEDRERVAAEHAAAVSEGRESLSEFRIRNREGKVFWVADNGRAQRDPSGAIAGTAGVLVDITARKLAEAELAKYRDHLEEIVRERTAELETSRGQLAESISRYDNLVQNSHSIILEWDSAGKILFLNRWGLEFFGFEEKELIGRNVVGTIVAPLDSAGADLAAKMVKVEAAPDEFESSENENIKKNGERVWISWTNRAIKDSSGKVLKTLSVGIDRTSQRQAELELAKYRDNLKELVAQRTAELGQKNLELTRAAERLSVATRASKIGIWDWDVPKNELVWDDGMYSLYNLRREDFAGAYEAWAGHIHPEDKARTEAEIQAALRGEREYAPEFRIVWPGGEVRTVKAESRTIRGPDGKPLRMVGTNIDVTEGRLAEQKLRDNEMKYRALFETADDAILLFADGKWVDCNKAAGRVFGCEREQILGAHPKQFSPPTQPDGKDSMEEAPRLIGLAYEGKPQSFSWTHCRLDGTPFFAEVSLNRVDLGGKPHIQAIVRDVTQRKLAEEALRESNRQIVQSQKDAGLGTYVLDIKTGVFTVSETLEEILGLKKTGTHTMQEWADCMHPEDRTGVLDYLHSEVLAQKRDADREYRVIRANDHEVRWLYSRGKLELDAQGVPVFLRGTSQDVTTRKASQERQSLYLSVLKRLGDGEASDEVISDILAYVARSLDIEAVGIRIERDGDFPFLSARGYTPEFMEKERTLCGKTAAGEPARDQDGNITLECLCGGVIKGTLGHDLPFMTKGGSLWLNSTSSLTPEQVGAVAARLVSFRGRCVDVGFESLALIPLRSKEKVIGLLHLADHRKARLTLELVEFLEGLGSSIAVVMQRKEAETAKARLEEEVRQSQKMESVGRLAGGVAHDFNNLLTAISGYGSMLARSMEKDDPRQADLAEMLGAASRGAALTQQLLAFSRKQVLNPVILDLNVSLAGMGKMIQRLIGEDIRLEMDLQAEPVFVRADSGQMGQVFLNLAVNARDAMPKGGTLRVSTRAVAMGENFFSSNPDVVRGPLAAIRVADNGCGMTAEVKKHIYEPFFTTKGAGRGTGLGLPTVYGIVRQTGGCVQVESELGKGTTFTIYLPLSAAPEGKAQAGGDNAAKPAAGHGERILLAEDDESLRRLGERILREAGYAVSAASEGREALALLQKGGKADLLIADVIMPGMGGKELAMEVTRLGLAGRILFVSGYTDDVLLQQGELLAGTELLYKPYEPEALLRKVTEMLKKGA